MESRIIKSTAQRGSVFFALFASVAMVGVLGAGLVTFIKGPLSSSVRVTRQNTAETHLSMGMRLAAMASATQQPSGGDCDGDGFIEPIQYRSAGAAPHPSGGGLIPLTIGAAARDPWGRDYGYCVFDHGPSVNHAGCGGGAQFRQNGANSAAHPALALIAAGPDGIFQTACRDFVDANADTIPDLPLIDTPAGSDDIAYAWTYAEAAGAVDGLWQLKIGDASTAEIDRNLSVLDGGGIEQMAFDIAAKALSVGAGGSGAFPTVKTDFLDALTMPSIEVLAPLNATASYSVNGVEIIDDTGLIVSGEQDPKIGTVEDGKWCSGGLGGVLTCEQDPPEPTLGGTIHRSAREDLAGKSSVDFPAIPAGVERVSIHVFGMSDTSGAATFVQLGDSGGVEITGYVGTATLTAPSYYSDNNLSTGFRLMVNSSARTVYGSLTLALVDPVTFAWAGTGNFGMGDTSMQMTVAGGKALSAELDRLRFTLSSGTWDAGYILVTWE